MHPPLLVTSSGLRVPDENICLTETGHIQHPYCREGKRSSSFSLTAASPGLGLGEREDTWAGHVSLGWRCGDLLLLLSGCYYRDLCLSGRPGRCSKLSLDLLDQIFLLSAWPSGIPSLLLGSHFPSRHSWEKSKVTAGWQPSKGCLKPIFSQLLQKAREVLI